MNFVKNHSKKALAGVSALGVSLMSMPVFAADGLGAGAATEIATGKGDVTTIAIAIIGLVAVGCIASVILGVMKRG